MNVFIIGLPKSCRTTVSQAIANKLGYVYISASDWVKKTFRQPHIGEHELSYMEEYHKYFFDRLKVNPELCLKNIKDVMICNDNNNFIIDGINSPRDFINLFDYNKDVIVILNRTDNGIYHQDNDNLFMSTIKDYCFWLASTNLLNKSNWIEYNFKINAEDSDYLKVMGTKNSVFLIKHVNRVISHLENSLRSLVELSE
jgi:adenylate kinase family enzyme